MAIGNPFGLGHTVTVGVISALDRPFGGTADASAADAPDRRGDQPGNSGGPLLNIRGEVVGMNTAIYTDAQRAANIGIGFATPINTIRELLPQLRTGKISRGVIGVVDQPRSDHEGDGARSSGCRTRAAPWSRRSAPDAPAAQGRHPARRRRSSNTTAGR